MKFTVPQYKKGIIIYWYNSIEHLEFDFDKITNETSITETKEWDCVDKVWRTYSTLSEVAKISDTKYLITIYYKPENNPEINIGDVCWGVSKIEIDLNEIEGKATWNDDHFAVYTGTRSWTRIDQPLLRKKRKITSTRLQRDQAKFRELLLTIDRQCILTGETTTEVLEAAHIIPASAGGAEAIGNGIILRADIHKLYDNDKFDISLDGYIVTNNTLSANYKNLLEGRRIDRTVLKRIKKALIVKKNLQGTDRDQHNHPIPQHCSI